MEMAETRQKFRRGGDNALLDDIYLVRIMACFKAADDWCYQVETIDYNPEFSRFIKEVSQDQLKAI